MTELSKQIATARAEQQQLISKVAHLQEMAQNKYTYLLYWKYIATKAIQAAKKLKP